MPNCSGYEWVEPRLEDLAPQQQSSAVADFFSSIVSYTGDAPGDAGGAAAAAPRPPAPLFAPVPRLGIAPPPPLPAAAAEGAPAAAAEGEARARAGLGRRVLSARR